LASSGEQLAALVDTQLKSAGSWSDVTTYYGIRELERHQAYPRICWVPNGGSIAQARYPGGRERTLPSTEKARSKTIRTAPLEHDVYIHHIGFENTENLWKAFVASVVLCTTGSVAMGDFEWITETQSHDYAVEAYMIRQRVSIRIPILDSANELGTVAITGQTHVGTFQGESGDEDVC